MAENTFAFIEIERVTKDKNKNNVVKLETIRVSEIKTFRPWFKTEKDKDIKGEMTMIILYPNKDQIESDTDLLTKEESEEKKKVNSVLIKESYNDFLKRMNKFVIMKS